ncbi:MAG: ATP-binding protein [Methyloceanibacter sp.]|uniref:ATP-binding protein n=1 Tax=Methyloceanibacter sp. TaxID=1965321 RepID=UPI003D6C8802
MITFNKSNNPNPSRLIESLRHIGYSNYEAIADLLDNSFDAEANKVSIEISKIREDFEITIADDGTGMDQDTLDEALRLGSLTERNPATDLGKFGMGLVTAGLSLSRRTQVITKENANYCTSIVDVEEIQRTNRFCKHLEKSTDDEKRLFDSKIGQVESGTLVILTKTDALTNRNTTQFANVLRKHLGEVHRHFLLAGKQISVNGEPVRTIDPLMLDHSDTDIYSDELYPIELGDGADKTTEQIRVRIALIPPDFAAGENRLAKALQHQGFYLMRNNRQIQRAATLDYFSKHNDFNRMRGEIFLSGNLDRYVGIEFTKRTVVFDQSIQDKLGQHLRAQCTAIKRRESGRGVEATSAEQDKFHEQASKAITEKSHLLMTPKAIVERRAQRTETHGRVRPSDEHNGSERKNLSNTQRSGVAERCRFVKQGLGPNGQIFECDLEGRTVVIRWNVEHPFYKRFIVDNQDDGRLVTAVDFLVYSMACAELRERDEDHVEFINNMKAVISANLRTLLT